MRRGQLLECRDQPRKVLPRLGGGAVQHDRPLPAESSQQRGVTSGGGLARTEQTMVDAMWNGEYRSRIAEVTTIGSSDEFARDNDDGRPAGRETKRATKEDDL